jgi:branched-chain amino acid transport system substrate-binding protein
LTCRGGPHYGTQPTRQGARPIDVTVARKLDTLAKLRAGMAKQGGIHALRPASVTHLRAAGRSLPMVQDLLGHRYLSTTARDLNLTPGRLLAPGMVGQWQKGEFEVVWPTERATAKPIVPKPAWP